MKEQLRWHSLSASSAIEKLTSDRSLGLSTQEVDRRRKLYGSNELPETQRRTLVSIFSHQFLSPLIYLLLVAAVIAFFVGDSNDSIIILVVVILNAIIGTLQEGRAEHSLEALQKLTRTKARIRRNGSEQIVESSEIVPGDLLVLISGDAVSADARVIEASTLTVAEASLTGESLPVTKTTEELPEASPITDRHNMVYAGTYITAGRGLAVVTSTGTGTEIGKIAHLTTQTRQPKTKLEIRIQEFGRHLAIAAGFLFFLVIGIGLWREIPFSQIFMIAISQLVSLVPEGLPVAMTIALAVGVQRMARKKTIVRRLPAVETLGSTTVICTDKTGTLTRNEMTVTHLYLPAEKREVTISGVGYEPVGKFSESERILIPEKEIDFRKLFEAAVLCNDATLQAPDTSNSQWRIIGDPTEAALLTVAEKGGIDVDATRKKFPRLAELPFNSDEKLMATQHSVQGRNIVYIKGAPEVLLGYSNTIDLGGKVAPLREEVRQDVQSTGTKWADSALRLLGVGYAWDVSIDAEKGFAPLLGKVTFLGLVGQLDPPREEVGAAVKMCRNAGIRTVMVTGDHKATGLAIARTLGISRDGDLAIDGQELDLLDDNDLLAKVGRINVFARVHPAQKSRIVEAFQKRGEIVAMTGDGVNDAPALMRANVGIAMGITGTEVAKEAAKIVITDDQFGTIVSAVEEGRLVYQNIRKLILFLFVTSIDEVVVLLLALVLGYPIPLAAVQILWINLVTEGTLTVNLIMEPAEGDEMDRAPVPASQPLLDRELLSRIPLMAVAAITSTFGWFVYRTSQGVPEDLVRTETFTVLAVCQWFNVLNCRSRTHSAFRRGFLNNRWLIGGLLLANGLHLLVIYWRPLGQIFKTVPIGMAEFFWIGVVASLVLWCEELRKLILRKRTRSIQ